MAGGAPVAVERVALEAGGHRQHQRTLARHHGRSGETAQQQRCGPVDVLEYQQARPLARRVAGEIGERRCGAAPAGAVVHRVEDRALLLALLQAEQVADQDLVLGCDEARLERAAQRRSPRRVLGVPRQPEEIGDHRRERLLALADSEVEHASQVTRVALRPGPQLQLFHQPGLADAGLAADHDGRARTGVAHAVEHTGKLPQLGLPAGQGKALARAVPQRRNAVHPHRDRRSP